MSPNGSVDESIFYKENKTPEEAKLFWEMFLKKFGARVEEIEVGGRNIKRLVFEKPIIAPRFVFPKTPNDFNWFIEHTDNSGHTWVGRNPFENAIFKKETIFYEAVFEGPISFKGAIFGGETHDTVKALQNIPLGRILLQRNDLPKEIEIGARFDEAIFLDVVTFKNAVFKSSVSFSGTVFKKGALFDGCKFSGKQADFSNSKFYRFEQEDLQNSTLVLGADEPALLGCSSLGIGACFNGVTFRCGVDFRNAKMEGASFMNAFFVKESTFEEAQFNGFAIFISAKFGDKVSFKSVKFQDDVTFSGASIDVISVLHSNAPFYEKLNMPSAQFYEEVTFQEAEFHSKTTFSKCQFRKGANFGGAIFDNGADFQWCVFLNKNITPIKKNYSYPETTFAKSIFKNTAFFDFAEFGKAFFNFATFEKGANFNNATFKDTLQFNESTVLEPIEFKSAMFETRAEFIHDKFRDSATFLESQFKGDVVFDWSLFEGLAELTAKYYGNISFKRSTFYLGVQIDWGRVVVTEIDAKKELMRVYIMTLKQEGRIREASRLAVEFKKELNRYQRKKGSLREKAIAYLELIFLELPSEYLTNWRRTVISSMILILIFGVLFCVIEVAGYGGIKADTNKTANNILNYLYFSAVTFTTLGYGDFHPIGIVKLLASIEAFLGVVYAAMISAILGKEVFVEEFEE
ncbi:pentapeptide repeat-containing protein [Thermococcus prieurii]